MPPADVVRARPARHHQWRLTATNNNKSTAAQTPSVVVPREANVSCINKLKKVLPMPHACYMIALLTEYASVQVLSTSSTLLPLVRSELAAAPPPPLPQL